MPYDFREDFDKPLARAVGAPDTVTLNGETLRCTWRRGEVTEYIGETMHAVNYHGRWWAVTADGYVTQAWGNLAGVENELTKWRLPKREPWWRRVWGWLWS